MDEEPDEHLEVGLFAAERQATAHQMGQSQAQRGVEAFDVLSASNPVQCTEDNAFVGGQAVCMTDRIEIWRRETLPQSEGAYRVSPPQKATDDSATVSV